AASRPWVAVSLVSIGYSRAHAKATDQLGQVSALRLEVERATPLVKTKTVDTSALVSTRAQRRAALEDAVAKEVAWDRTLADVARVLPATVWLSDMTVVSPTPADAAVPTTPAPA